MMLVMQSLRCFNFASLGYTQQGDSMHNLSGDRLCLLPAGSLRTILCEEAVLFHARLVHVSAELLCRRSIPDIW